MEFVGEWKVCPDGVARPTLLLEVQGVDGQFLGEHFFLDPGADRTVISADFNLKLRLPSVAPPSTTLSGIGGTSSFILAATVLRFKSVDGLDVPVSKTFPVFTDPRSSDYSILGRDLLDAFDVLVERGRGRIRLLSGVHSFQIVGP